MMRFRNLFYVSLLLIVFSLIGCGSAPVRYTYEEIKGYSPEIQDRIMRGEIALGMTKQQVRYAWGSPDQSRLLEPLNGKMREEWIYTRLFGVYEEKRLLFIDDKLTYILPEPQKIQTPEK
ncbi:MAG: hypothetical protein QMD01_07030 [Thermodesulfovibrionales bacterium]|nr:hypothetical protein [Thermodesulfovibrionales bacterium]